MKSFTTLSTIGFGLLLLVWSGCGNPVEPTPTPAAFTYQDESTLGDQMHEAMVSSTLFDVLPDDSTYAAAYAYLSGLRVRLLATDVLERRRDFDWAFHILKDDNHQRCFTTVGGKLYVSTGLLRDMVNNEAELMGILAHELYYADASYHLELLKDNFNIREILDVMYGGADAEALAMIGTFYNTPRERNLVLEADQFGANLLCVVGDISINALADVIHNVTLAQPTPTWYVNHPTPGNSSLNDRLGEIQAIADNCNHLDETYLNRYLNFLSNLPPR